MLRLIQFNRESTYSIFLHNADILARPDIQGEFDIKAINFLDFTSMALYLQKNTTSKVSSVARSRGGREGGSRSDRGLGMPANSDVQDAMGAINRK